MFSWSLAVAGLIIVSFLAFVATYLRVMSVDSKLEKVPVSDRLAIGRPDVPSYESRQAFLVRRTAAAIFAVGVAAEGIYLNFRLEWGLPAATFVAGGIAWFLLAILVGSYRQRCR